MELLKQILKKQKLYQDCLIIGDGERTVTLEEIHDALYGKIDSATRIDINTHGDTGRRYVFLGEERHVVGLSSSSFDILGTETKELFQVLAKANQNKPVYVHLWSCLAADAEKDFEHLPDNSFAVFHSSKNQETVATNTDSLFRYDEYNGNIEGVKANLLSDLESIIILGGTVKFRNSGITHSITYLLDLIPDDYVKDHTKVLSTEDVEQDLQSFATTLQKELGMAQDIHI